MGRILGIRELTPQWKLVELSFDILSLNTAGLGDYEKQRKVFNYVKRQTSQNGIIFLQETYTTKRDETI